MSSSPKPSTAIDTDEDETEEGDGEEGHSTLPIYPSQYIMALIDPTTFSLTPRVEIIPGTAYEIDYSLLTMGFVMRGCVHPSIAPKVQGVMFSYLYNGYNFHIRFYEGDINAEINLIVSTQKIVIQLLDFSQAVAPENKFKTIEMDALSLDSLVQEIQDILVDQPISTVPIHWLLAELEYILTYVLGFERKYSFLLSEDTPSVEVH